VNSSLRFTVSGEVVCHTAAVEKSSIQLQILIISYGYTDNITAFPRLLEETWCALVRLVASLYYWWNCDTSEIVKSYKGLLKKRISYVFFFVRMG
jgi:hypothetical protein